MEAHHRSQNSVQEFVDLQDHQYFPGYFTGGKVHPFFKSHSKFVKYVLFIVGTFLIFISIFSVWSGITHHSAAIDFLPLAFITLPVGSLCLLACKKSNSI